MKLPTTLIELIGMVTLLIFGILILILFKKVFSKSNLKSLDILGNKIELSNNDGESKTLKVLNLLKKSNKLDRMSEIEIIKRQMNYSDMRGTDIINLLIDTFQEELYSNDYNTPFDVSLTKIEDFKNFQLIQELFYYKMKNLCKKYFRDNGFERFVLTDNHLTNSYIEEEFVKYKESRVSQIFDLAKEHSGRFYTGRHISNNKLDMIISEKLGAQINGIMDDIFEYARKVYVDVSKEIKELEQQIDEEIKGLNLC